MTIPTLFLFGAESEITLSLMTNVGRRGSCSANKLSMSLIVSVIETNCLTAISRCCFNNCTDGNDGVSCDMDLIEMYRKL